MHPGAPYSQTSRKEQTNTHTITVGLYSSPLSIQIDVIVAFYLRPIFRETKLRHSITQHTTHMNHLSHPVGDAYVKITSGLQGISKHTTHAICRHTHTCI